MNKIIIVAFLVAIHSIASAQTWEKLVLDNKVTIQIPGSPTVTQKPGKTSYSLTYPAGEIRIERNTIPDSVAAIYGNSDNFDFYYNGFVASLAEATGWKMTDEQETELGEVRIRSFKTKTPQGTILWSLFMIDKQSYLVTFNMNGESADAVRVLKSLEIKQ